MNSDPLTNTAEAFITADDIGTAITTLRGEKTQKHCARRGGLDRPSWNQYEKGKAFPKPETIERIARGLGVEVIELTEAVIVAWSKRMNREPVKKKAQTRTYTFTMEGRMEFVDDVGFGEDL